MRIGLIGAGAVGQSVGALLVACGWCRELRVASGSQASARGLVTDLEDMAEVTGSPMRVTVTTPQAMGACDAIVLSPRAPFTNRARSDVRMAGLIANGLGPAGAVLDALAHTLGILDCRTEVSVHQDAGVWLGMPVHYTSGTPALRPPSLGDSETAQLAAATEKLHTAYARLTEEI
ncbi:lactate/malate family dehydrogenase [Streptomyces hydrogenans]|uniref:lactate/malate family dehydrogenase n=1 Tax=Streptomyces hydrogenans TaxID=1873719 RepID=UPI0033A4E12B